MRTPKSDWTDLFLAFRLLLDPRKLWLAFKGVVLSAVLIGVLLAIFASIQSAIGLPPGPEPAAESSTGQLSPEGKPEPADTDVLDALRRGRIRGAVRATRSFAIGLLAKAGGELRGVLSMSDRRPLERVAALWTSQALLPAAGLGLLSAFVLLFIWSYYGAAIMRLAGVEYALGDRIELKSATAYTRRKHQLFYGPPLGLALAVIAIGLLLMAAGLLVWNLLVLAVAIVGLLAIGVGASVIRDKTHSASRGLIFAVVGLVVLLGALVLITSMGWRVPYAGEVALGILSPLALVGGLIIVILCIWMILGLPLMAGVVATTNVGVFEAWSRSFHYLFTHPWRYLSCVLCAVGHGAACLAFVYFVRLATEWATFLPLSAGAILLGGDVSERLLTAFLSLDRLLLDLIFLAFVAGYAFTSQTIIYFLLRRWADGTPISEVHLEPRDRERVVPATAPAQN